jgi:type I restriction-modification system DNA methylase subunit
LAQIVTAGKPTQERLRSHLWFWFFVVACGQSQERQCFFGRDEPTTYNLCRMNMIMHDVHYKRFDIKNEDTLERPLHLDMRFEAIVANPLFG